MGNNLVCKNRMAALSALDTMAANMPRGTPHDALIAVRDWMLENMPRDFDPKTVKKIQSIFEGTDGQKRGRAWMEKELEDPAYAGHGGDHPEFIHEPEDGAELNCVYRAKYKKWVPVGYGWPGVLHKQAQSDDEE